MPSQPIQSIANTPIFRELSGDEASSVFAHDLEQAIINMLASGEFKRRAKAMFLKTGKFGLGACYPVVIVEGQVKIKVFTSVESYRSNEKLPEPFDVQIAVEDGEMLPDTEPVCSATTNVNRTIGVSTDNAVDRVRKEVGLDVLVPARNEHGYIENSPQQAETRKLDYEARLETRKATIAKRDAEREAEMANEEERERIAREAEARGVTAESQT